MRNKRRIGIVVAIASMVLSAWLGNASAQQSAPAAGADQPPTSFSSADRAAIEALVRDYLLRNPGIIVEALQILEAREREAAAAAAAELREGPGDPILGNPRGDVVVVEFFDYRCPYCRKVAEPLKKAVREDGNVKLVMKEWPILGPPSVYAARIALAAMRQGKYEAFHEAMMATTGTVDEATVLAVADRIGLDRVRLERDIKDPQIDAVFERNRALARRLGITGTPAFFFGDTFVPGAISYDEMKRLIKSSRAARSGDGAAPATPD